MRSRSFILVGTLLAGLVLAVGGVYAYDASRDDLIAEGVHVAGVDLGGLRADQARAALERELLTPLDRPVVVAAAERRFHLTSREARVGVSIGAMVDAAVRRSRRGSIVERTARGLTGGRVDAELPAQIVFSREAVGRLVSRVRGSVNRPARDASVDFSGNQVTPVQSRRGRRLDSARLRREVEAVLRQPNGERTVRARARTIQPAVTTDELAAKYPQLILVNRSSFQLRFFKRLRLVRTYRIAVGQIGLETPAGLYHVQNKAINPAWNVPNSAWAGKLAGTVIPGGAPNNPLKARWLGIFAGAGIHGTDAIGSLGSAASHGCIRMAIPDVVELYDQVPVGTPVYIA